jgi:hypothetical protein
VLIIILACTNQIITGSQNNSNSTINCTYSNFSEKNYVSKNSEECEQIKFECDPSTVYFIDKCGCGCRVKPDLELLKVYCTDEERGNKACEEKDIPVCGWYNRNIKCIRYPCAQDFINSCYACADDKVYYWTQGRCPE